MTRPPRPVGRGAIDNPKNRFESIDRVPIWEDRGEELDGMASDGVRLPTSYYLDQSQSIVSQNTSPDIPFRYSLNPYRGCAHGCSYCYARPTHEFLGWSAGVDFESHILVKDQAAMRLRQWLSKRHPDQIEPLMLSGVTDPYQPAEGKFEVTRQCLNVALDFRHPLNVITKNRLICRDLDLLSELAHFGLVHVTISVTSLDQSLTRIMEPRTSAPAARLRAIRELAQHSVPVSVMVAPIIPGLNDEEVPAILRAVAEAGAASAGFVPIRLPLTVVPIFCDWLGEHFPDRKQKVLNRIRSLRGGELNDTAFGRRMRGEGFWADQFRQLFTTFCRQYGLGMLRPGQSRRPLRTDLFRVVDANQRSQGRLF